MKKKYIYIEQHTEQNISSIYINNIRTFPLYAYIIERIVRIFNHNDSLYYGFYRYDKTNITDDEFLQYTSVLLEYFELHGKWEVLGEHLYIATSNESDQIRKLSPYMFDCFLYTLIFLPNIDWTCFKKIYANYMHMRLEDYILKGYADCIFQYYDSGDFSVCFNPRKHDSKAVLQGIQSILQESGALIDY